MRIFFRGIIFIMLSLSLVACKKQLDASQQPGAVAAGGIYYTQVGMHYEKNVYPTTNYQVGVRIPINTQIRLLEMGDKTIDVEVGNPGQKIVVKNFEKHTGDNIKQVFNKLFARQKVNLAQFSALEKEHIESGTVVAGMSKKAVTTAIGYPPITRTPNLSVNSWVFWRHKFNTFAVNFKDGKVSDIVD